MAAWTSAITSSESPGLAAMVELESVEYSLPSSVEHSGPGLASDDAGSHVP
jgi:hypothetical protein